MKIFFLWLLGIVAFSQELLYLSQEEALQKAYTYKAELQNAKLDHRVASAKVKETLGIGLPQINASADGRYMFEIPTTLLPGEFFGAPPGTYIPVRFGVPWNVTLQIEANQLLFNGSYFVGVQAAKAFKDLTELNIQLSQKQLKQKVLKAYYNVLIIQKRAEILQLNIEQVQKTLQNVKALQQEGFAEALEAQRLQVAVNNLLLEQQKIEQLIKLARNLLKFQCGIPLTTKIILTDTLPPIEIEQLQQKVRRRENFSQTYTKRLEWQVLQQQIRLRKLNIRKEKTGYWPTLVAYSSIATQAQRNEFNIFDTKQRWFPIGIVGIKLQVPIFDGLQRHYRIQQTQLELLKTQNQQRQLEESIHFQTLQTQTQLQNQLKTLEIAKQNMLLAQDVVQNAEKKYKAGVGSNIELIQAQNEYRQARVNYYNALLEAYNLYIDFKYALGEL